MVGHPRKLTNAQMILQLREHENRVSDYICIDRDFFRVSEILPLIDDGRLPECVFDYLELVLRITKPPKGSGPLAAGELAKLIAPREKACMRMKKDAPVAPKKVPGAQTAKAVEKRPDGGALAAAQKKKPKPDVEVIRTELAEYAQRISGCFEINGRIFPVDGIIRLFDEGRLPEGALRFLGNRFGIRQCVTLHSKTVADGLVEMGLEPIKQSALREKNAAMSERAKPAWKRRRAQTRQYGKFTRAGVEALDSPDEDSVLGPKMLFVLKTALFEDLCTPLMLDGQQARGATHKDMLRGAFARGDARGMALLLQDYLRTTEVGVLLGIVGAYGLASMAASVGNLRAFSAVFVQVGPALRNYVEALEKNLKKPPEYEKWPARAQFERRLADAGPDYFKKYVILIEMCRALSNFRGFRPAQAIKPHGALQVGQLGHG